MDQLQGYLTSAEDLTELAIQGSFVVLGALIWLLRSSFVNLRNWKTSSIWLSVIGAIASGAALSGFTALRYFFAKIRGDVSLPKASALDDGQTPWQYVKSENAGREPVFCFSCGDEASIAEAWFRFSSECLLISIPLLIAAFLFQRNKVKEE
jgi:hypothetical protein